MNSTVNYMQAIQGATSFDDILATFVALNLIVGKFSLNDHIRHIASTQKVRSAIEVLKSGTQDVEEKYFALDQLNRNLWGSDLSDDERNAIYAEYREPMRAVRTELFNFYSSKGKEALAAWGIHDDLAAHAQLVREREAKRTELNVELDKIEAEYRPKITAAYNEHVKATIDQMIRLQSEYETGKNEILSRCPHPYKDTSSLSPEQLGELQKWTDELAAYKADFQHENKILAEESSMAIATYRTPLEMELYDKKRAKLTEIGGTSELRNKQKQIVKDIHQKVINHLLTQSPVAEDQAADWIERNAIMNKQAIIKAKRAGYDPKDVMKDLSEFYRITGGRIPRLAYTTTRNTRSQASPLSGNLYVGSNFGKQTFYHELAHLLENDTKLAESAQVFLEKRRESKELVSLRSLTGNRGYKSDERAFKDNFAHPYVGKFYPNGITEVFSMGMQHLSSPEALMELQEKDPEHLALMLGVCLSRPHVDEDQKRKMQAEVQQKKAAAQKTDDVMKELDKKISQAGKFWDGHVISVESYTPWRKKSPVFTVKYESPNDGPGGSARATWENFRYEKDMKRALYLWLAKGKPSNGQFSLSNLAYSFRGKGVLSQSLIEALSGEAVPELPKNEG